jgi:hypothetical protein
MSPLILAQIDKVQPAFLHQAVLLLCGILGGAASVAAIVGLILKRRRIIEPQPLEVKPAAEYVTKEFCADRHTETKKRLDEMSKQVDALWSTMRSENTAIRGEMTRAFQDIERALGRIEGKIDRRTPLH